MKVKPFKDEPGTRKEQVKEMFNRIAGRYDFLNHLLSFNIDKRWRRKLRDLVINDLHRKADDNSSVRLLDVATGTGDLAFVLSRDPKIMVTGLDISEEMIKIAMKKALEKKSQIEFMVGDSEFLPFEDNSFDYVTVAFGVRNFEDLEKGLKEFVRVLKPGGMVFILEFSKPDSSFFNSIYRFYSNRILPRLAALFVGEPRAYIYLPESISAFPGGNEMLHIMGRTGFNKLSQKDLSGGIAKIYSGSALA